MASPAKRLRTVFEEEAQILSNASQEYGSSKNVSFWLGCGKKNKKQKQKNDCSFWVHQWCVELYYKFEEVLSNIPYYCQRHGKGKRLKEVGRENQD